MSIQMRPDIEVLIVEAQQRLNIALPVDIEQYIFGIFYKFLKEKWSEEPLALAWLKIVEQKSNASPLDLRDIGDTALMISSLSMPAMKKRGLRQEYFLTFGSIAYGQAGVHEVGSLSQLYYHLSDAFSTMVSVIENIFNYRHEKNVREAVARLELVAVTQDAVIH